MICSPRGVLGDLFAKGVSKYLFTKGDIKIFIHQGGGGFKCVPY